MKVGRRHGGEKRTTRKILVVSSFVVGAGFYIKKNSSRFRKVQIRRHAWASIFTFPSFKSTLGRSVINQQQQQQPLPPPPVAS